jgi:hypothetical protein
MSSQVESTAAYRRKIVKEQIEVMRHYANGGEIECKVRMDASVSWEKVTPPLWNWCDFDYRIKPKEPRVIYCIEFDDGTLAMLANKDSAPQTQSIKFVEVLP